VYGICEINKKGESAPAAIATSSPSFHCYIVISLNEHPCIDNNFVEPSDSDAIPKAFRMDPMNNSKQENVTRFARSKANPPV